MPLVPQRQTIKLAPLPKAKKSGKASFYLLARKYPNTKYCDVWLHIKQGPTNSGLLHNSGALLETVERFAAAHNIHLTIEKSPFEVAE